MLKANETALKLSAARDLIANIDNWCSGSFCRGSRYCAVGALAKTCGINPAKFKIFFSLFFNKELRNLKRMLDDQAQFYNNGGIMSVNDKLGHKAVLTCFDSAIFKAQSEYF